MTVSFDEVEDIFIRLATYDEEEGKTNIDLLKRMLNEAEDAVFYIPFLTIANNGTKVVDADLKRRAVDVGAKFLSDLKYNGSGDSVDDFEYAYTKFLQSQGLDPDEVLNGSE